MSKRQIALVNQEQKYLPIYQHKIILIEHKNASTSSLVVVAYMEQG